MPEKKTKNPRPEHKTAEPKGPDNSKMKAANQVLKTDEKVSFARKLKKLGSTIALKADILRTRKNQGSTEHVNKLYNLFAPFYDLVWPSMKDYVASTEYIIAKSVKPGHRVLDVGTGTGVLALLVAERGNKVIGFDLHPKMLERTRKKAHKKLRSNPNMKNLELCRGDATVLPFADRSFDVVTSGFMLVHLSLEQRMQAVGEMLRVLKPDGMLGLLESPGELAKRYDTREDWERALDKMGFEKPVIEDIYDVYRVIFAKKKKE